VSFSLQAAAPGPNKGKAKQPVPVPKKKNNGGPAAPQPLFTKLDLRVGHSHAHRPYS
jgi:hypothetical protein